jgi:O-acetyl-ADP-ribose deacetylase (regulator of RNase III)
MFTKFNVLPLSKSCDCPFYGEAVDGSRQCFFKTVVTPPVAMMLVEGENSFTPELYTRDCGGEYQHCAFIPLLYHMDEANIDPAASSAQTEKVSAPTEQKSNLTGPKLADTGIDDFNPFDDQESDIAVLAQVPTPEVRKEPEVVEEKVPPPPFQGVQVKVARVTNPYLVKADVLVYPANNLLIVDDPLLVRMTNGKVQDQCDEIPRPIIMGNVYITQGKTLSGNVAIKQDAIYHAVVAGASRLVNTQDIASSIRKALLTAEANGATSVAMLPCDNGTHDLNQSALVQLSTVSQFLKSMKLESLRHIFIVMEDQESLATFETYYRRIFGSNGG